MVQTRSQQAYGKGGGNGSGDDDPAPPPALAIFSVYLGLGCALSFGFGRDLGAFPPADEMAREVSPTIIIICLFLTSYTLLDVMAVGAAKQKYGFSTKRFGPWTHNPPEEVYLALRAQTNQVEQLPGFLVGALSFSILVNSTVGAVLSLTWTVLRRIYASRYRRAMGQTIKESKIGNFTIPAYFALNAMLMGTAVHCARLILS
jgi:uncharacterized MAPEG superfamily protein